MTGRFAAMTASLLARKGDASPSAIPDREKVPILWSSAGPSVEREVGRLANVETFAPEPQPHAPVHIAFGEPIKRLSDTPAAPPDHAHEHDKRHRVSLALSVQEHEKLGIVAIKRGVTRHQLMREALDYYFEKLAMEYSSDCACIATGGCRNGCSGAAS